VARVVHFEFAAIDPVRAIAFYENVLDWRVMNWEGPVDYWLLTIGEQDQPGIDGALMRRQDDWPDVINTVDMEDLEATVAAAEANGGKRVTPRSVVPGVGYMSYVSDSEDNIIGLLQSDPTTVGE